MSGWRAPARRTVEALEHQTLMATDWFPNRMRPRSLRLAPEPPPEPVLAPTRCAWCGGRVQPGATACRAHDDLDALMTSATLGYTDS